MRLFCIVIVLLCLNVAQGLSLHEAIRTGNSKEFEKLSSDEKYLNEEDGQGNTPAHVAVIEGKLGYLKSLKRKGANLGLINRLGDHLVHTLIKHDGSDEMFRWLMGQEFLLDKQNQETSESQGDDRKKVRLNDKNYAWDTPLMLAIKKGDLGKVKALVKNGASPDVANGEGETAFLIAVLLGDKDIIGALLKSPEKIDFQAESLEGQTPIGVAVARGDMSMTREFFAYGADAEFVNVLNQTLLHISASNGHVTMTQSLLDKNKIPVDAEDRDGNTALLLAAARGDIESVIAFVANGANPKKTNKRKENALHLIYENSARGKAVAQQLIKKYKLDAEAQDIDGNTALHYFVKNLNIELLEFFLLNFEVQADLTNRLGQAPLDLLEFQRIKVQELDVKKKIVQLFEQVTENNSKGCPGVFEGST